MKKRNRFNPRFQMEDTVIAILAVLGFVHVLAATSRYGSGVSTDAVAYLSAADNLASGQGFFDYRGQPILWWPPLYPAILASLKFLFQASALSVGRFVNAFAYACTIFSTGRLLGKIFSRKQLWVVCGVVVVLLSESTFALALNIGPDMLFTLLVVLFINQAYWYLDKPTQSSFILLMLIAALAPMLRITAVTLIVVGALILILERDEVGNFGWRRAIRFGLFSSLPLMVWMIGRNYRLFGSLSGTRDFEAIHILENISFALPKIAHWFLPYQILDRVPISLGWLFGVGLIFFLLLKGWGRKTIREEAHWLKTLVLFSVVYLVFVICTTFTPDHFWIYDDRYYVPLLIPLLSILFIFIDGAISLGSSVESRRRASIGLIVIFLIWLNYPAHLMVKMTRKSLEQGVPYYNLYNTQEYHDSTFTQLLQEYQFNGGIPLYSNLPSAVYFHTGHQTEASPRDLENERVDPSLLGTNIGDWPGTQGGYLIWFLPNDRPMYYSPELLEDERIIKIELEMDEGIIYRVEPYSSAD